MCPARCRRYSTFNASGSIPLREIGCSDLGKMSGGIPAIRAPGVGCARHSRRAGGASGAPWPAGLREAILAEAETGTEARAPGERRMGVDTVGLLALASALSAAPVAGPRLLVHGKDRKAIA